MHNNYYFLKQISARLEQELKDYTLVSCFSQNKDEIVFEFNNAKKSFFIRADLQGDFSCLTFPDGFKRARKNSIDLFDEAIMKKVVGVRQFLNERSFMVNLEEGFGVLFKMHGNKSNVLLVKDGEVTEGFKESLSREMVGDREIDMSNPITFGRRVWDKAEGRSVNEIIEELNLGDFFIYEDDKGVYLSLLKENRNALHSFKDPIEAVNVFYNLKVTRTAFEKEKHAIVSSLRTEIASTKSWLEKTARRTGELKGDEHYKMWGDLLMANLHAVGAGKETIELEDFYNQQKITIKLDPQLSPQKNAERYYRKGKNQQIEIAKLNEAIEAKVKKLKKTEEELEKVEKAVGLHALPRLAAEKKTQTLALPYREIVYKGFKIWIGKDAKANDELTLKNSYKEDLWLHVRDDSGSHVLIKHQAGKSFPKDVIETAASYAAFFSKRKTESLCSVIVTPKKFVRKRKGDPPGAVVVEREEVILVEPKNPQ